MGGIPVLNDSQMTALRRIVGTNPKLNLTVTPKIKPRNLPTFDSIPEEASSYNGYFTIKDVSTRNEQGEITQYRYAVCDGATWNPDTQTSGDSFLRINYAEYLVPCTIVNVTALPSNGGFLYLYLYYTISTAQVAFTVGSSLPADTDNVFHYLIGNISWAGNIVQRHIAGIGNGIAQIWPLTRYCGS